MQGNPQLRMCHRVNFKNKLHDTYLKCHTQCKDLSYAYVDQPVTKMPDINIVIKHIRLYLPDKQMHDTINYIRLQGIYISRYLEVRQLH